jgi:hypothetical protein
MRLYPNLLRLRIVALGTWITAALAVVYGLQLSNQQPQIPFALVFAMQIFSLIGLAIGIGFWQLSTDRQANIQLEPKGISLQLGHAAAFVHWDNIAALGVTTQRDSWLSLGSQRSLGIRLNDLTLYTQSYEERLPTQAGVLGLALRQIKRVIGNESANLDARLLNHLTSNRKRTSYDIIIPETFLGGQAAAFVKLADAYRIYPVWRRSLD